MTVVPHHKTTCVKPAARGPSRTTSRRNQPLSTDNPTSRFLYSILRQCDLRSVNWQEVANDTGVTRGHTARMRYSRFKNQMDAVLRSEDRECHEDADLPVTSRGRPTYYHESDCMPMQHIGEEEAYVKNEVKAERPLLIKEEEQTEIPRVHIDAQPESLTTETTDVKLESTSPGQEQFGDFSAQFYPSLGCPNAVEDDNSCVLPDQISTLPHSQQQYPDYWGRMPYQYVPQQMYRPFDARSYSQAMIPAPDPWLERYQPYSRTH